MTTILTTYRAALEAIRDGSDAVCPKCGWIGSRIECDRMEECRNCGFDVIYGPKSIAAYALEQGGEGMIDSDRPKEAEAVILAVVKYFNLERPNTIHLVECDASPSNGPGQCNCCAGQAQAYFRKYLTNT